MTQIQQISHSTWDVCCHPWQHAKGSLVTLGGVALAVGITAGVVLSTAGGSENSERSRAGTGPTSVTASTVEATSTPAPATTASAAPSPSADVIYFDPAAGLFDTRSRPVVATSLASSGARSDPAAGMVLDGQLVGDPAAGMAVYPTNVSTVETSVGPSAIYFDPAAGLFDTRSQAVVATGTMPSLISFDPAAGLSINGAWVDDPAAGMALDPAR